MMQRTQTVLRFESSKSYNPGAVFQWGCAFAAADSGSLWQRVEL